MLNPRPVCHEPLSSGGFDSSAPTVHGLSLDGHGCSSYAASWCLPVVFCFTV